MSYTTSRSGLIVPSSCAGPATGSAVSVQSLSQIPYERPNDLVHESFRYVKDWMPGTKNYRDHQKINDVLREARDGAFYVLSPFAKYSRASKPDEKIKAQLPEIWVRIRDDYAWIRMVMFNFIDETPMSLAFVCSRLARNNRESTAYHDPSKGIQERRAKDKDDALTGMAEGLLMLHEAEQKAIDLNEEGRISFDMGRSKAPKE